MIQQLFFGYFAIAITVLALLVITRKNPIHSVAWMLLLFFHIASLYLFLNAEFLAAVQVIVYAGGILVLFLFAVLLVNVREEMRIARFIGAGPTAFTFAIGLLVVVLFSLRSFIAAPPGIYSIDYIRQETNTVALGKILYTEFLYPFEIASLILLVAIVGAIVLAKKRLKS